MTKIEKMNKKAPSYQLQTLALSDVGFVGIKPKKMVTGYATWVRALMQNWRQGTVGCKDRSEVNRTNKKPWKQKGTGRARAGTARSPLWRGGGVIFGPQPRVRTLRVSHKLKNAILRNMLIGYIEKGKVIVADWDGADARPSTAMAAHFLKTAGFDTKKVALLLPWSDTLNRASFSNIPQVNIVFTDQVNACDMSGNDVLVLLKKDLEHFKEVVARWI